MNKAILVGNLTKDPEHRTSEKGISITTFTVAVQRRFTQGEQKADFLNIVTWRVLADNCVKYLQKGSKVGIVGQIQTRNYEDKQGVKRYVTEIIADEVEFLSSKDLHGNDVNVTKEKTADDLFGDELSEFQPADGELPF